MRDVFKVAAALFAGIGMGFGAGMGLGLTLRRTSRRQREADDRQRRVEYRQIEALMTLERHLTLRAPMPPMRGYAISPDFAVIIMQVLRDHQPQHILELGCGVSTLVGAYTLEQHQLAGKIVSVEHQADFAQFTRDNLARHGLTDFATVLDAPLIPLMHLHRWRGRWYDLAALDTPAPIDLLIIDGPPQYRNPSRLARYPALPMLYDRLAPGALILIDDADRRHERRAIKRWLREFDLIQVRQFDTEKGTLLLQKRG